MSAIAEHIVDYRESLEKAGILEKDSAKDLKDYIEQKLKRAGIKMSHGGGYGGIGYDTLTKNKLKRDKGFKRYNDIIISVFLLYELDKEYFEKCKERNWQVEKKDIVECLKNWPGYYKSWRQSSITTGYLETDDYSSEHNLVPFYSLKHSKHIFALLKDKEVLLRGQAFIKEGNCKVAIKQVKRYGLEEDKWGLKSIEDFEKDKWNEMGGYLHYFYLKNGKGEEIGRSGYFDTEAEAILKLEEAKAAIKPVLPEPRPGPKNSRRSVIVALLTLLLFISIPIFFYNEIINVFGHRVKVTGSGTVYNVLSFLAEKHTKKFNYRLTEWNENNDPGSIGGLHKFVEGNEKDFDILLSSVRYTKEMLDSIPPDNFKPATLMEFVIAGGAPICIVNNPLNPTVCIQEEDIRHLLYRPKGEPLTWGELSPCSGQNEEQALENEKVEFVLPHTSEGAYPKSGTRHIITEELFPPNSHDDKINLKENEFIRQTDSDYGIKRIPTFIAESSRKNFIGFTRCFLNNADFLEIEGSSGVVRIPGSSVVARVLEVEVEGRNYRKRQFAGNKGLFIYVKLEVKEDKDGNLKPTGKFSSNHELIQKFILKVLSKDIQEIFDELGINEIDSLTRELQVKKLKEERVNPTIWGGEPSNHIGSGFRDGKIVEIYRIPKKVWEPKL